MSILKKFVKKPDVPIERVLVPLNVCEKHLLTLDEQLDQMSEFTGTLCSDQEWQYIYLKKK